MLLTGWREAGNLSQKENLSYVMDTVAKFQLIFRKKGKMDFTQNLYFSLEIDETEPTR